MPNPEQLQPHREANTWGGVFASCYLLCIALAHHLPSLLFQNELVVMGTEAFLEIDASASVWVAADTKGVLLSVNLLCFPEYLL